MPATTPAADRAYWVATLLRVARPVLAALAQGQLRARMPVETLTGHEADRTAVTHLEALGRTLAGIAPWLENPSLTGPEEDARRELADLARRAIASATDPSSPDMMNFDRNWQVVVDGAFFAQSLLRAPRELWTKLDAPIQTRVIAALRATHVIRPSFNNWLLFAAIVEVFMQQATGSSDLMRIDYAVRQHEQWYLGDGTYSDGPLYHWDYYNSFVIHPMLLDVVETMSRHRPDWQSFAAPMLQRAQRQAVIQERLIAPDGSFPPIGRSITYRCGAFQLLGQLALQQRLPPSLPPAQIRSALTAVIRRTLDAPDTFDAQGWLRIGLCGHQPGLGEDYISTGSLYLCLTAFLPLGLPPASPFWSDPPHPWTSQQIWSGLNSPCDKAMKEPPAQSP